MPVENAKSPEAEQSLRGSKFPRLAVHRNHLQSLVNMHTPAVQRCCESEAWASSPWLHLDQVIQQNLALRYGKGSLGPLLSLPQAQRERARKEALHPPGGAVAAGIGAVCLDEDSSPQGSGPPCTRVPSGHGSCVTLAPPP